MVRRIKTIGLKDRMSMWCAGKHWPLRAVLALFLSYNTMMVIWDPTEHHSFFSVMTLAFHELGHVIWSAFGEWMMVAGGSLNQLLVPVAAGAMLWWKQRDYFGTALMGFWLASSMVELSLYIGDARALALPLVSLGGGDPKHDWEYLLERAGLLQQDKFFAGIMRAGGFWVFVCSLALTGWLLYQMQQQPVAIEETMEKAIEIPKKEEPSDYCGL